MPRIGRAILLYYPHHVVQRGHNRQVVFAEARDNERYLETLAQFKDVYGVKDQGVRVVEINTLPAVLFYLPVYSQMELRIWPGCRESLSLVRRCTSFSAVRRTT
jgi:hypothetical protein